MLCTQLEAIMGRCRPFFCAGKFVWRQRNLGPISRFSEGARIAIHVRRSANLWTERGVFTVGVALLRRVYGRGCLFEAFLR